jgi:3-hydroxybutyryl-CoA dehydratase
MPLTRSSTTGGAQGTWRRAPNSRCTEMHASFDTPPLRVGEKISREITIDADDIRQYAMLAGDENPLHHDEEIAKRSRFGGLIASGTHTCALMMAAIPTYLSKRCASVGLGFSVRLRQPVRAGERLHIEWTIVSIKPSARLSGHIVTFEGKLETGNGQIAITATQEALIFFDRSGRLGR